jgi:hypothetical protein
VLAKGNSASDMCGMIEQKRLLPPNIAEILRELAEQRPAFHSEADFQHALAWELHRQMPLANVRLELPRVHAGKVLHVDIWMTHQDTILALELKYKTRKLSIEIKAKDFKLLDHSAQDIGRYDFVKDIQRLEQLCSDASGMVGYAILLTNDSSYWAQPKDRNCVDAAFRIPEGRIINGLLRWNERASSGTMRGREEPLTIEGTYPIHWEEYSRPEVTSYGRFRYTVVEVR